MASGARLRRPSPPLGIEGPRGTGRDLTAMAVVNRKRVIRAGTANWSIDELWAGCVQLPLASASVEPAGDLEVWVPILLPQRTANLTWKQAVVHSRAEGNVVSQARMTRRNPLVFVLPTCDLGFHKRLFGRVHGPGGCGKSKMKGSSELGLGNGGWQRFRDDANTIRSCRGRPDRRSHKSDGKIRLGKASALNGHVRGRVNGKSWRL